MDTSDEKKPTIHKVIEPEEILKFDVATMHTLLLRVME
uniref:Selenium-binding protein 1-a n=1 Tax=Triatoma infestans TaxID=30076 RepID=A0A170V5F5_TRIIF